jgi:hypothetical protein
MSSSEENGSCNCIKFNKGEEGVSPRDQFSPREKRSKWVAVNIFGNKNRSGHI